MKSSRILVVGIMIMIISVLAAFWSVDPNDPNIGAGVLFLAGIGVVIAGLAHLYASKHPTQPPHSQ